MTMYESAFARKSVNKFDTTALPADVLKDLESYLATVKPLLADVKITYKILGQDDVKGMMIAKTPHYFLVYGEQNEQSKICAGYLAQHAELWLFSKGYGTHWYSTLKSNDKDPKCIGGFAFGKPVDFTPRTKEEFNKLRKPLNEIAIGDDPRLEATRLAPSGLNKQPWYFVVDENKVHVFYLKSLGGLMGKMYKMTPVDLGLALAHFDVASEHLKMPYSFGIKKDIPFTPKKFTYAGTIEG